MSEQKKFLCTVDSSEHVFDEKICEKLHLLEKRAADNETYKIPDVTGEVFERFMGCVEKLTEFDNNLHNEIFKIYWKEFSFKYSRFLIQFAHLADLLGHTELTTHVCQEVGELMASLTTDEIAEKLDLKSDFSDAEKAQIAAENEWCVEF